MSDVTLGYLSPEQLQRLLNAGPDRPPETSAPVLPPQEPEPIAGEEPIDRSRPIINNRDNTFSTEKTATFEADGKFYLIPTIVGGKEYPPGEAFYLWKIGQNKAVGVYPTNEEASKAAIARSAQIGELRGREAGINQTPAPAASQQPELPGETLGYLSDFNEKLAKKGLALFDDPLQERAGIIGDVVQNSVFDLHPKAKLEDLPPEKIEGIYKRVRENLGDEEGQFDRTIFQKQLGEAFKLRRASDFAYENEGRSTKDQAIAMSALKPEERAYYVKRMEDYWKEKGPIDKARWAHIVGKELVMRGGAIPFYSGHAQAEWDREVNRSIGALKADQEGRGPLDQSEKNKHEEVVFQRYLAEREFAARGMGASTKAWIGVFNMLPYATEFMATTVVGGALLKLGSKALGLGAGAQALEAAKAAQAGTQTAAKASMGARVAEAGVQGTIGLGKILGKGALVTAFGTPTRVEAEYEKRQLPSFGVDADGKVQVFGGPKETPNQSLVNAITSTVIDNATEFAGGAISKVFGVGLKGLAGISGGLIKKMPMGGKVVASVLKAWQSKTGKALQEGLKILTDEKGMFSKAGFHGMLGELGEEYSGQLIKNGLGLEGEPKDILGRLKDGLGTVEDLEVMALTFSPMALIPGVGHGAKWGLNKVQQETIRRRSQEILRQHGQLTSKDYETATKALLTKEGIQAWSEANPVIHYQVAKGWEMEAPSRSDVEKIGLGRILPTVEARAEFKRLVDAVPVEPQAEAPAPQAGQAEAPAPQAGQAEAPAPEGGMEVAPAPSVGQVAQGPQEGETPVYQEPAAAPPDFPTTTLGAPGPATGMAVPPSTPLKKMVLPEPKAPESVTPEPVAPAPVAKPKKLARRPKGEKETVTPPPAGPAPAAPTAAAAPAPVAKPVPAPAPVPAKKPVRMKAKVVAPPKEPVAAPSAPVPEPAPAKAPEATPEAPAPKKRRPLKKAAKENVPAPAAPEAAAEAKPKRPPKVPRAEDATVATGNEATLTLPGTNETHKVRYAAIEAADAIPSHEVVKDSTGKPVLESNQVPDMYQYREMGKETAAEPIVEISENLRPAELLSDAPSATYGPPTGTKEGFMAGGNQRTAAIKRSYAEGRGAEYKAEMVKRAAQFGLDPKTVEGMSQPILVRISDSDEATVRNIAKYSNMRISRSEGPLRKAHEFASLIDDNILEALSKDETGAFGEMVTGPKGKALRDKIWESMPTTERDQYFSGPLHELTPAGKELVQNMLTLQAFSVEEVERMSPNVKRLIGPSIPQLVQMKRPGSKVNLTDAITEAVMILNDHIAPSGDSPARYYSQGEFFAPKAEISPNGRMMLDWLYNRWNGGNVEHRGLRGDLVRLFNEIEFNGPGTLHDDGENVATRFARMFKVPLREGANLEAPVAAKPAKDMAEAPPGEQEERLKRIKQYRRQFKASAEQLLENIKKPIPPLKKGDPLYMKRGRGWERFGVFEEDVESGDFQGRPKRLRRIWGPGPEGEDIQASVSPESTRGVEEHRRAEAIAQESVTYKDYYERISKAIRKLEGPERDSEARSFLAELIEHEESAARASGLQEGHSALREVSRKFQRHEYGADVAQLMAEYFSSTTDRETGEVGSAETHLREPESWPRTGTLLDFLDQVEADEEGPAEAAPKAPTVEAKAKARIGAKPLPMPEVERRAQALEQKTGTAREREAMALLYETITLEAKEAGGGARYLSRQGLDAVAEKIRKGEFGAAFGGLVDEFVPPFIDKNGEETGPLSRVSEPDAWPKGRDLAAFLRKHQSRDLAAPGPAAQHPDEVEKDYFGPGQWPKGADTETIPHSAHAAVQSLGRVWGVPIRRGLYQIPPKALGRYNRIAQVIRIEKGHEFDVFVASHEVAHHIWETEDLENNLPTPVEAELSKMDYNPNLGRPEEGFAEFVRLYWSGEQNLSKTVVGWWEGILAQNAKLAKNDAKSKKYVQQIRNQDPKAHILGFVSATGKYPSALDVEYFDKFRSLLSWSWMQFRTKHINDAHALYHIERLARKAGYAPKAGFSLTELFEWVNQVGPSWARDAMENGVFSLHADTFNHRIGPALADMRPLIHEGEMDDFTAYAVATHTIEKYSKGLPSGIRLEKAVAFVQKYFGTEQGRRWSQAHRILTQHNNATAQMLMELGTISREEYDRIVDYWETYLPDWAIMPGDMGKGMSGRGYVNLPQELRARHGHALPTLDPVIATQIQTADRYQRAAKQIIVNALAEMAMNTKGMGAWVNLLEPEAKGPASKGFDVASIMLDGEKRLIELDPDLYKAVSGQDTVFLPTTLRLVRSFTNMVKIFATGALAINFPLRNMAQDFLGYLTRVGWGGRLRGVTSLPFEMTAAYIAHSVQTFYGGKGNSIVALFNQHGGQLGRMVGVDIEDAKYQRDMYIGKAGKHKGWDLVRHPLEALEKWTAATEMGPRLAAARISLEKNGWTEARLRTETPPLEVVVQAMTAAHRATIDWRQAGTYGKFLRQIIPYYNVPIQAFDQTIEIWQKEPKRCMTFAIGFASAVAVYWYSRHDDDDWKDMPAWEKYGYFTFPREGTTPIALPMSNAWMRTFGGFTIALLDKLYEKDPASFSDWFKETAVANLSPAYQVALAAPILEAVVGKKLRQGIRDIVPPQLQERLPYMQTTAGDSIMLKALALRLHKEGILGFGKGGGGFSPAKVQYFLSSLTGGGWQFFINNAEAILLGRKRTPKEIPVIGGLLQRKEYYASPSEFYERADWAKAQYTSARAETKEYGKVPQQIRQDYMRFTAFRDFAGKAHALVSPTATQAEETSNDKLVNGIFRAALNKPPLASMPDPFAKNPSYPKEFVKLRDEFLGSLLKAATASKPLKGGKDAVDEWRDRRVSAKNILADIEVSKEILSKAFNVKILGKLKNPKKIGEKLDQFRSLKKKVLTQP